MQTEVVMVDPKEFVMEEKVLTFGEKMLALYERFAYVQKTGTNAHFKYNFLQESMVKRKLSAACRELGLGLQHVKLEVVGEATGKACVVKVRVVIRDAADHGCYVELEGIGGGMDTGDKAPQKALTAAFKSAIATGLMVETGDDSEADRATDEAAAAEVLAAIEGATARDELELVKPRLGALKDHTDFPSLKAAFVRRKAELTVA